MKNIVAILLALASFTVAEAQSKNNVFADIGINERGIAATYDRKLTRHFEIGAGVNSYYYKNERTKSRTAFYVDLRPYWVIGKSTLFVIVDIGGVYNAGSLPDSESFAPVTVYGNLGVGYHYRINKRGMGPYLSLGLQGYYESQHYSFSYLRGTRNDSYGFEEFFGVLALGFKF
jgi:hypothetical protein